MEKHGPHDDERLAKAVQDVLRSALKATVHYGVEESLHLSSDRAYQTMQKEGWID